MEWNDHKGMERNGMELSNLGFFKIKEWKGM